MLMLMLEMEVVVSAYYDNAINYILKLLMAVQRCRNVKKTLRQAHTNIHLPRLMMTLYTYIDVNVGN